jgi:hypothetical protein
VALGVVKQSLVLLSRATPARAPMVPLEPDETVVMVEWATGANVARWTAASGGHRPPQAQATAADRQSALTALW